MSPTTVTETTSSPALNQALSGRYGNIGIVAVSAALMFSRTNCDGEDTAGTGRASTLPVFARTADYVPR